MPSAKAQDSQSQSMESQIFVLWEPSGERHSSWIYLKEYAQPVVFSFWTKHTYIKRTVIVKDVHVNDVAMTTQRPYDVPEYGVDLSSLCERRGGDWHYLLEYDPEYRDMSQLKWSRAPNATMRNDEYVLLRDTDAVICW